MLSRYRLAFNKALESPSSGLEDRGAHPRAVPTWWPNPDTREFKKNGLDWWVATRDGAWCDEVTPYCVGTALAKKWGNPVRCREPLAEPSAGR